MLISVSKRFVFVANTKAASTSFEHRLFPYCEIQRAGTPERKHIPLAKILGHEYRFLFDNPDYPADTFFKFGVIRDPIEWIGSWYRYRKGNKTQAPIPAGMSFQDFYEKMDWNFVGWGRKFLQSDKFRSESGHILADYLIPYEDLEVHAKIIFDAYGIEGDLPKKNSSELGPETLSVPSDLIERLRDFYKEDYDLISRIPGLNEKGLKLLDTLRCTLSSAPPGR
ncbi:MAG TPA: sulfotransferase family 2 domain-containing protein [Thermohalobaculum sp.]|nr:sulfotransferase family 2 domain-containing protein [Thermohalobaculum sp.]